MPNKIIPDKNEIARYLGVKGKADRVTAEVIESCIAEMDKIITPRYIYGVFNARAEDKCIYLEGTELVLTGNDIYAHLKDCEKCAVMAATLGINVDNAIRLAQNNDMLRAVTLDACAAEYIEKLCDSVEDEIKAVAANEGFGTNFRFSPGYGDLPLDLQREVLSIIDAPRKIGVTLTSGNLMTPTKSVTAIVGFTKETQAKKQETCDICSMRESCAFRKEGTTCGR